MNPEAQNNIPPSIPTNPQPIPQNNVPLPPSPTTPEPVPQKSFFTKRKLIILIIIVAAIGGGTIALIHYRATHRHYTEAEILTKIRSDILPSIVQVRCANENGGDEAYAGTGVYFLDASNSPMIETNAHVVLGDDGKYHGCNIYFPRPSDGSFYDSVYTAGTPYLYNNLEAAFSGVTIEGLDYALLPINQSDNASSSFPFPPPKPNAYDAIVDMCQRDNPSYDQIAVGNKIFIIGYPKTGGDSLTMTDGIMSGFTGDNDEFLKVSASTNHGNSGGLAIGESDGCNYGIPTRMTVDQGSNLGYVLDAHFIRYFQTNITGKYTYTPPPADEATSSISRSYDFPTFSMNYPDEWTVATGTYTTFDNKNFPYVQFVSPSEGALDNFNEKVVVETYPSNNVKSDFNTIVSRIKKQTKDIDPNSTEALYNWQGIKFYQNTYTEQEQDGDSAKIAVEVFANKGTLYQFMAKIMVGQNTDNFASLVNAMIGSMKFN